MSIKVIGLSFFFQSSFKNPSELKKRTEKKNSPLFCPSVPRLGRGHCQQLSLLAHGRRKWGLADSHSPGSLWEIMRTPAQTKSCDAHCIPFKDSQGKLSPTKSKDKGWKWNYAFQECLGEGNEPNSSGTDRYFGCPPCSPPWIHQRGKTAASPAQVQRPLPRPLPGRGRPGSPEPLSTCSLSRTPGCRRPQKSPFACATRAPASSKGIRGDLRARLPSNSLGHMLRVIAHSTAQSVWTRGREKAARARLVPDVFARVASRAASFPRSSIRVSQCHH